MFATLHLFVSLPAFAIRSLTFPPSDALSTHLYGYDAAPVLGTAPRQVDELGSHLLGKTDEFKKDDFETVILNKSVQVLQTGIEEVMQAVVNGREVVEVPASDFASEVQDRMTTLTRLVWAELNMCDEQKRRVALSKLAFLKSHLGAITSFAFGKFPGVSQNLIQFVSVTSQKALDISAVLVEQLEESEKLNERVKLLRQKLQDLAISALAPAFPDIISLVNSLKTLLTILSALSGEAASSIEEVQQREDIQNSLLQIQQRAIQLALILEDRVPGFKDHLNIFYGVLLSKLGYFSGKLLEASFICNAQARAQLQASISWAVGGAQRLVGSMVTNAPKIIEELGKAVMNLQEKITVFGMLVFGIVGNVSQKLDASELVKNIKHQLDLLQVAVSTRTSGTVQAVMGLRDNTLKQVVSLMSFVKILPAFVDPTKLQTYREGCFLKDIKFIPLNMAGQARTEEPDVNSCQRRCRLTTGCVRFSFWPNGGCHLQDTKSRPAMSKGVLSGSTSCVAVLSNLIAFHS